MLCVNFCFGLNFMFEHMINACYIVWKQFKCQVHLLDKTQHFCLCAETFEII